MLKKQPKQVILPYSMLRMVLNDSPCVLSDSCCYCNSQIAAISLNCGNFKKSAAIEVSRPVPTCQLWSEANGPSVALHGFISSVLVLEQNASNGQKRHHGDNDNLCNTDANMYTKLITTISQLKGNEGGMRFWELNRQTDIYICLWLSPHRLMTAVYHISSHLQLRYCCGLWLNTLHL